MKNIILSLSIGMIIGLLLITFSLSSKLDEARAENIILEIQMEMNEEESFDKYGELTEQEIELCNSYRNQSYNNAVYSAREEGIICHWEYNLEGNRTQDSLDAVEWIEKNI